MPFLCRESPNVLRGFVSPAFLIAAAHVFPRFLQSIRGCVKKERARIIPRANIACNIDRAKFIIS